MSESSNRSDLKSAYEVALARLDTEGIRRPSDDALDDATREKIAAVRRKAEADLAQLEILFRDRQGRAPAAGEDSPDQQEYLAERRRIEARRDARLRRLRGVD